MSNQSYALPQNLIFVVSIISKKWRIECFQIIDYNKNPLKLINQFILSLLYDNLCSSELTVVLSKISNIFNCWYSTWSIILLNVFYIIIGYFSFLLTPFLYRKHILQNKWNYLILFFIKSNKTNLQKLGKYLNLGLCCIKKDFA